jgi:hypothetical protein
MAFVLSVAQLWGQHQFRVLHPRSLLFILLLVLTFAAAVGGLVGGLWRRLRGPYRGQALGWAVCAILPVLFWTFLGFYAFRQWAENHVPHNLVFILAKNAGASLMEAQARCFYASRLDGERIVMFYDDRIGQRGSACTRLLRRALISQHDVYAMVATAAARPRIPRS